MMLHDVVIACTRQVNIK